MGLTGPPCRRALGHLSPTILFVHCSDSDRLIAMSVPPCPDSAKKLGSGRREELSSNWQCRSLPRSSCPAWRARQNHGGGRSPAPRLVRSCPASTEPHDGGQPARWWIWYSFFFGCSEFAACILWFRFLPTKLLVFFSRSEI